MRKIKFQFNLKQMSILNMPLNQAAIRIGLRLDEAFGIWNKK